MKRHDQEKMRILYQEWKESGKRQSDFATGKGIRADTFYYWTSKFRKESSSAVVEQSVGFSPIAIADSRIESESHPTAVIHYPSGARLEIHAPLEAQFIKTLIE